MQGLSVEGISTYNRTGAVYNEYIWHSKEASKTSGSLAVPAVSGASRSRAGTLPR